ncbi:TRAP transporter large permease subunit [Micromonospora sp. M12]
MAAAAPRRLSAGAGRWHVGRGRGGAILSPPTLGAAAFIIAEYLGVSYLQVLGWATVPTVLYYLGILLSVEIDARRSGVRPVVIDVGSPWRLLARFGYHFASLIAIIVFSPSACQRREPSSSPFCWRSRSPSWTARTGSPRPGW